MNGTENPSNSGTRATRESRDRLAVLRPPTLPPPRRWLSSGCIVISWNERWKCKNVTFAVASRWRSDCESISQCRRVQGGTLIKREQFWSYQTMYTEVITVCSLVAKQRSSWLRPGHALWLLEDLLVTFNRWGLLNHLSEFRRNWINGVGGVR